MSDDVVKFIRRRDYRFIRELGRGGCGRTVLLQDDVIDAQFVCKKYEPNLPELKEEPYQNFVNEIKLMHRVHHPNVVRIFNYHLVPHRFLGFIVMEYVAGLPVDKYIEANPGRLSAIFKQVVGAFCHLGECKILHRDIRSSNILVDADGNVKLIDLGFGKRIQKPEDFDKSITINWAYTPPQDFDEGKYDFRSEVYFVGKMFNQIIRNNDLLDDRLTSVISVMCSDRPRERYDDFSVVRAALDATSIQSEEFEERDVSAYREFANQLDRCVASIENRATYIQDASIVAEKLQNVYSDCMLEEYVSGRKIVRCFINGSCKIFGDRELNVGVVRVFLQLFRRLDFDRRRVVLSNLFSRLDGKHRYDKFDQEIPF